MIWYWPSPSRFLVGGLLGLLSLACTQVDQQLFDPFDDAPPVALESFPIDGQEQVPIDSEIRVWFSEPLDPFSINLRTFWLYSGEEWALGWFGVRVEEDGRGLVVFHPDRPLVPGVRYTLRLTTSITDLYGNPLPDEVVIQFFTEDS